MSQKDVQNLPVKGQGHTAGFRTISVPLNM